MTDLAPCPFCASPRVVLRDNKLPVPRFVACRDCNALGPDHADRDEAARLWNERRTEPILKPATVTPLR